MSVKIFTTDIVRLLQIDDMWKAPGRVKPKALEYEAILNGSFVPPPLRSAPAATSATQTNGDAEPSSNGHAHANGTKQADAGHLKDQRELSVKDNLELFLDRLVYCD